MMSVAGGWFFLMACEMFVLGNRDFRLPGLGSFLQTAASHGNTRAILWGLAAMVTVIVLLDQLIWRPVIDWIPVNVAVGPRRAAESFTVPKRQGTRRSLLIVLAVVILAGVGF